MWTMGIIGSLRDGYGLSKGISQGSLVVGCDRVFSLVSHSEGSTKGRNASQGQCYSLATSVMGGGVATFRGRR